MNNRLHASLIGLMISGISLAYAVDTVKRDYIQQLENALKNDDNLVYKERKKLNAHLHRFFKDEGMDKHHKRILEPLDSQTQRIANLVMKSYKGISSPKSRQTYAQRVIGMIDLHTPAHKRGKQRAKRGLNLAPLNVKSTPTPPAQREATHIDKRTHGASATAPKSKSTTRRTKQAGPGYKKSEHPLEHHEETKEKKRTRTAAKTAKSRAALTK